MHGRILVVDPIATNRIVLRVKLAAAHYEVEQADCIAEAEKILARRAPDAVLTVARLDDGDAAMLVRRIRRLGLAGAVPVLTLLDSPDPEASLMFMRAGVDEVEVRPVEDSVLIARLRSLVRASASRAEWQMRDDTSRALGFAEQPTAFERKAEVVLVHPGATGADTDWISALSRNIRARITTRSTASALGVGSGADAYVLILTERNRHEILPLLAAIRSSANTRHSAILVVQETENPDLAAHALDLGAGELMVGTGRPAELTLRLERLISQKRIGDRLRATMRTGLEAAVSDPLTGLHNRRYALPHLARIAENAVQKGKPFAVMVADIDHFKQINDQFGHAAGDAVLVEIASRLRENLRALDMVARIGGEEFLIVLPATGLEHARLAGKRLCEVVRDKPFRLPDGHPPTIATISIGLTVWDPSIGPASASNLPRPQVLLDRADQALYEAKAQGRDRILLDRSAA